MAYYNGKKVLSVVQVKEVEVDYYVGVATLENEKQDEIIVPQYIKVNNTNFPILENTKTALVELGGNSVSFNQLLNRNITSAQSSNGLTATPDDNGFLTISGTATANTSLPLFISSTSPLAITKDHKYLLMINIDGSDETYIRYNANGFQTKESVILTGVSGNGASKEISADRTNYPLVYVPNGTTLENVKVYVHLFDLTLMGLDSITSVDEFKALFPNDYYPYQESNIKSTILSNVKAYSTDGDLLGAISLPNAPLILNGVNDIHDLLTFEEQADGTYNAILTSNFLVLDLGTINWGTPNSNGWVQSSETIPAKPNESSSTMPNAICDKYPIGTPNKAYTTDGYVSLTTWSYLTARDSSFIGKTKDEMKTAMSGVNICCELATPTTETIATGLTFDQVATLFEKGGTLEIANANSDYIKTNSTMAFAVRRFRSVEE